VTIIKWMRATHVVLAFCFLATTACGTASEPRADVRPSLGIKRLTGSVAKIGSWDGYPLLGVKLRATVCTRGIGAAYPDEIRITHYDVGGSPKRWSVARTVVDHAPWLVPLGETWHGKSCGLVLLDDAIPPVYYDAVSLGNPNSCYGVRLTIKVGARQASRRAIIRCGGLRTG
jgi:hypothetical protein